MDWTPDQQSLQKQPNYGNENSEWLIIDKKDVRPYGILVKEA